MIFRLPYWHMGDKPQCQRTGNATGKRKQANPNHRRVHGLTVLSKSWPLPKQSCCAQRAHPAAKQSPPSGMR